LTDEPRGPEHGRQERTAAEERMSEALGPELGSDAVVAAGEVAEGPRPDVRRWLIVTIVAIIALQLFAFFVVPPFPPGERGEPFSYPTDGINANFELPAPHVAFDLDPSTPPSHDLLTFDLTISSSLFTSWIVMAVIVVLAALLARSIRTVPSRGQNALEYVYEGLANFVTSLGGPPARRYLPVFAALFIFILLSNWSGLLPGVGRVPQLRAPTSDVNMTIGLALLSFTMFHVEGVRALGVRGYLGKFFSLRGFREGIGAGIIALFVGVLEFLLEFVKPVTLSMRLFGNIYAGEIALGVITALTIAIIPVAMIGLEVLLNFMQALIFAVLTLMFTLAAIEPHHEEEHEGVHAPEGGIEPKVPHGAAA
jgi:F-type H+-transporting ATPase subunit a